MTQDEQEKKKLKKKIGKRIRRITLIVLKPFGKEDDAKIAEKLSSEDYEKQYAEWVDENYEINGYDGYSEIIEDGTGLVPTRYVYMANTRIYRNNITFWYENTSG